jgi:hypothetical protein
MRTVKPLELAAVVGGQAANRLGISQPQQTLLDYTGCVNDANAKAHTAAVGIAQRGQGDGQVAAVGQQLSSDVAACTAKFQH